MSYDEMHRRLDAAEEHARAGQSDAAMAALLEVVRALIPMSKEAVAKGIG